MMRDVVDIIGVLALCFSPLIALCILEEYRYRKNNPFR